MAGSVNKVILVGNLGRDPEVRTGQSGARIVTFSIATSDTWNDRATGERRERTEWHKIVIFNERLGDVAEKYLKKGRKVYIEGSLQTRKWADQAGVERYTTEIIIDRFRGELVLIDSQRGNEGDMDDSYSSYAPRQIENTSSPAKNQPPSSGWEPAPMGGHDLDDEIPF